MQLDLSRLEQLGAESPQNSENGKEPTTDIQKNEKGIQGKIEGIAAIKLNREQENNAKVKAVYEEHQKNILISESLQSEILKGIRQGESPIRLLLKAVKTISLMTGTELLYTQAEADIRAIYGAAFCEPEPLEDELIEVMQRLDRLREAYERERGDSKQRIYNAIKKHEQRADELHTLIAKSKNKMTAALTAG